MYIVFDTETTGLPKKYNAPYTDTDNWPRMVQLAWINYDENGLETERHNYIIKPEGYIIPEESIKIHRITNEKANAEGHDLKTVLELFTKQLTEHSYLVAHNLSFDENVVGCEFVRKDVVNNLYGIKFIDTKDLCVEFCKIPSSRGYKWPTLTEVHMKLFGTEIIDAHDAIVDVEALGKCFFELKKLGWIGFQKKRIVLDFSRAKKLPARLKAEEVTYENPSFVHLGVHTDYSVFQAAGSAENYCKLAKEYGQKAIGITDFGSLSGAFNFSQKCKDSEIKSVLGAELYLNDNIGTCEEKRYEGENFLTKVLVKDSEGYVNLNRLLYMSFDQGYYFVGRMKTEWLLEHNVGLFVTTSGLRGKINHYLSYGKEELAEKYLLELHEVFKENLLVEIEFNNSFDQKIHNDFVLRMAEKYNLRVIVTNNVLYAKEEDSQLKDIIVAIGQKKSVQEMNYDSNRHYYFCDSKKIFDFNQQFGFNYPDWLVDGMIKETEKVSNECNFKFDTNEKFPKYEATQDVVDYFKTTDTTEIITKLAHGKLKQRLKECHIKRVLNVTLEVRKQYEDRLNYELQIIGSKKMLDYFLVLWELIRFCNENDISVGPGRGCFVPGSRVKMEDGLHAPIETITKGDVVFDAYGDRQVVTDTLVYNIDEEIVELEFEDGRIIKCTKDHEIFTINRGWVKAIELTNEDNISDINCL